MNDPHGYCAADTDYISAFDEHVPVENLYSGDRYQAVNMAHYNKGHIELRLPGGQKNFPCFRNTFEVIFHLVEVSKSISRRDCDNVVKIFSGCNKYVYDRLATLCRQANTISQDELNRILHTVTDVDYI
jgi:hypothetical protein